MSTVEYCFLEPLDVLFLRGNKLFGDPGSFGESLVPPWPSVVAGALRSRMLADAGVDLAAFARGVVPHVELGTPERPGSFTVAAFHLARRRDDGTVEILIQPPADLVVMENEAGNASVRSLNPTSLPTGKGLATSNPLPLLPVLADKERAKPTSGYWLTESGWKNYLVGEAAKGDAHLEKSDALWKLDHRVGVGLDSGTRRAAEGRLFSTQAVAMTPGIGFLAAVTGATAPKNGTVQLGGDGRAAAIHAVEAGLPEPDYEAIVASKRCRLVLSTPGIFPQGWRLPGMDEEGLFRFSEIRARVASAAVPRFEVVSGWDLAKGQPKTAQRAAPAGSVYWLENLEATPEALRKLAAQGLWNQFWDDPQRRAEGFNRVWLASWN